MLLQNICSMLIFLSNRCFITEVAVERRRRLSLKSNSSNNGNNKKPAPLSAATATAQSRKRSLPVAVAGAPSAFAATAAAPASPVPFHPSSLHQQHQQQSPLEPTMRLAAAAVVASPYTTALLPIADATSNTTSNNNADTNRKHEQQWNMQFDRVAQFKRNFGHLNVPAKDPAYHSMYGWLTTQKASWRKFLGQQGGGGGQQKSSSSSSNSQRRPTLT
jgi:Helicase associated domain